MGIANIYARDAMAPASHTLNTAHPGRFTLELAVRRVPLVERFCGHSYRAPLTAMRSYLGCRRQ